MALTGLEPLMALRDLSRRQLMEHLGATDADVTRGVDYQGLTGVDRISVPRAHPAHFFFADDRLAMIYAPRPPVEGARALQDALGGPGAQLRSRAGKRAVLHAYPEQGVAFSSEGDSVKFAEVFPPMPLDRYLSEVYVDPGAFIE